jgi:hypothetical protein
MAIPPRLWLFHQPGPQPREFDGPGVPAKAQKTGIAVKFFCSGGAIFPGGYFIISRRCPQPPICSNQRQMPTASATPTTLKKVPSFA